MIKKAEYINKFNTDLMPCYLFKLSEPLEDFPRDNYLLLIKSIANSHPRAMEYGTVYAYLADSNGEATLNSPILYRQPGSIDEVLTELGYTGIGDY